MTGIARALTAFWGGLGLPCYESGQVPAGAAFPYLVFDVKAAPFGQTAALTATGYFRAGDADVRRAEFLNRAGEAVPEGGTLLTREDGLILLTRAGEFLSCVREPGDRAVLGGRIRVEARYY